MKMVPPWTGCFVNRFLRNNACTFQLVLHIVTITICTMFWKWSSRLQNGPLKQRNSHQKFFPPKEKNSLYLPSTPPFTHTHTHTHTHIHTHAHTHTHTHTHTHNNFLSKKIPFCARLKEPIICLEKFLYLPKRTNLSALALVPAF